MDWFPQASFELTDPLLVIWSSKSSSLSSTEVWLKPTASLVGWGEKLGTDPCIGQPRVLWIMSGALFLGGSEICPNLSVTLKRLLCIDRVRYVWSGTIHRLSLRYV
jgi:hypothetical protein